MVIVDTNVVSEAMRDHPEPRVANWLRDHTEDAIYTTAITKAEILYGIEIATLGRKRSILEAAAERVFGITFSGRILPFDDLAALHYAQIAASRRARGHEIRQSDAEIAAITRRHHATLATRNVRDFEDCGIRLVNPWEA